VPQVFADVIDRGARMRFADFAEAETCTSTGRLIFGVLVLVARYEYELIQTRTGAGLRAARARRAERGDTQVINPGMAAQSRAIHNGAAEYKDKMLRTVRGLIAGGQPVSAMVDVLSRAGWTTYEVGYGSNTRGGNAMHKMYVHKAIDGHPEFRELFDRACEARALAALDRIAEREADRKSAAVRRELTGTISDAALARGWGRRLQSQKRARTGSVAAPPAAPCAKASRREGESGAA